MYSQYKAASNKWMADIPTHWNELFIQQVSHEKKEKNIGNQESNVLSLSYGRIVRKKNIDVGLMAKDLSTYQIVDKDDIVLRFTDLQNDHKSLRTGLVTERGIITSAYTCIVPSINASYLHYLLHSYDTRKVFYGMGGGVRQSIGFDDIRHMFVPVPPKDEQDQIVRYLDWQISNISKLIHGYQKQIKLLEERKLVLIDKMVRHGVDSAVKTKESGVEYIDQVPEHWTVLQNHRLFKSMGRKFSEKETVLSLSQKDGLIPYENMTERSLHTASYDNWQLVLPNDLVLNRFKAHLGVFFASRYRGIVTFHYGVYEPKMQIVSKYYEALYHTPVFRRVYAGQSKGMTVGLQNLSDTDFYTVYTVYPPKDEQEKIVQAIEKQEQEYQNAKLKIEKQIALLNEYRIRLISDVVTGQIDVRGIEIPDYVAVEDVDSDSESQEEGMEDAD